jgi:hypothetical protein
MRFVALLVLGLLLQAPPPLEPGFTALWNGKDFTGWRLANPDSFSIENGAIVAHGKAGPGHAFYDGPFRNHTFRNFELKVDVMTRAGSNGGIYMMTEFVPTGWPAKGFEVQVNNTYVKDPIKTGSLYQVVNVNTAPAKDDVWFTEHIVVQGDTVTVRVNDVQTITWTQPADWQGVRGTPGRRLGPGTIALQAHDPASTVLYRNIRIKPLD